MVEIRLSAQIEERGQDKYGVPATSVRAYVERAIRELGLDNNWVDDTDSAMYAWRLSHQPGNAKVAGEVLQMQDASLSELARVMADADPTVKRRIETDPRYIIILAQPQPSESERR
jgi:hypothetical protein